MIAMEMYSCMFLRIVFIGKIWTMAGSVWWPSGFLRIVFIGKIWTICTDNTFKISSWGLYLLVRFERSLQGWISNVCSWGLYLLVRFEHWVNQLSTGLCSWGLYLLVRFELHFRIHTGFCVLEDCIYW